MERITPPLRLGDRGAAVTNLQQALLYIVEKRPLSPQGLSVGDWTDALSREMGDVEFGQRTQLLFEAVLAALELPAARFVDPPSANALNRILDTLGAFVPPEGVEARLAIGNEGPAVGELQAGLRELGYSISLPEAAAQRLAATTLRAVESFQRDHGPASRAGVDDATGAHIAAAAASTRMAPYVVAGVVRRIDGRPVASALVQAFDVDFRRDELLGEGRTDREGRYAIAYSAAQAAANETRSADLRVRVRVAGADGVPEVNAESAILFNAPREAVIDVLVEAGARRRSGYESTLARVQELAGDVSPADFTADDLRFLAGETRIESRRLAFLVVAHRHARATGVAAEAFFALFWQGSPTRLGALLLEHPQLHLARLRRSIRDEIVPEELARQLDAILAALRTARSRHLLTGSDDADRPLRELLHLSGVADDGLAAFLDRYVERSGTLAEFWDALRRDPGFPAAHVDALQFTLQLGLLTRNDLPLMRLLRQRAAVLTDLVPLRLDDWRALIAQAHDATAPLPPDLPGDTDDQRIAAYAASMFDLLQDAMPMAFVRDGIARDTALPAEQRQDLTTFLGAAPAFDLLDTHVTGFLAAHPGALQGIGDSARLTADLKRLQRAFRITERIGATLAFIGKGWDSARVIAETPFSRFLESIGEDVGGYEQADMYYKKAKQTAAFSAITHANIYDYLHGASPAAVGKPSPHALTDVPDWEGLFGSIDFCDCEHCRSIFGPAAYFVDLLQLLRRDGAPYLALTKRRPDVEHVKLTCANTHVLMPLVDIVNEVMEFFVVKGSFDALSVADAQALAKDTGTATAEELSVNPQYADDATTIEAYQLLGDAVFSFRLPFNLPLETARAYLEHSGASLHDVMAVFQNTADAAQPVPDDLSLANEYLKIGSAEATILAGESTALPRAFFGYASDMVAHEEADGTSIQESWVANLARVPEFIRRTGLPFADVVDMLKTRFINPVQAAPFPPDTIVLSSPEGVCDLSRTRIQHLDGSQLVEASWVRIHRFLRLRAKLGWPQQDLDRAVGALGTGEITRNLIGDLARVARLAVELNQPVSRLVSLWANLPTSGDDAPYARLFQSKAVTNPVDAAFALNQAGSELADLTAPIDDHVATLQAAMRISADDLARLRLAVGLSAAQETLGLGRISLLYRHALLAKSLKLKMREYLALRVLAGSAPSENPAATVAFVDRARAVKASPFKVAELDYLFRHVSEPGRGPAPAEDATLILLESLQKELLKIVAETQPVADPTTDILRSKLALVLDPAAVEIAVEIVDGTSPLSVADQEQFIDDELSAFVDPTAAKAALLPPPAPDDEEAKLARLQFLLPPLLAHLRDVLSRSLVKQTLSSTLPIEAELVQLLLEEILPSRFDPSAKAISDFLSLAQGVAAAERLLDFTRVHKAALIFGRFKAAAREVSYIAAHGADFGGFDLSGMPLERADAAAVDAAAPALFTQWELLRDFFRLRDSLPQGDVALLDVVAAASAADARATLATLTGWEASDVDLLSGAEGLGVADPDFKNARGPARLFAAFASSRRLGISGKQLLQWAQAPVTSDVAQDIVRAVKAKYEEKAWLEAARPLSDGLREKRKLALIAYLLADAHIVSQGITDANGLYEYFLIDVNMDPCMMTTRIVQATSAVQLFIQRSLLNLETGSVLSEQAARRWRTWMMTYRLWEAGRKVFTHPENWLAARRIYRTPFFSDFEAQLLQNGVTPENVEQAFMTYLERLDEVARLDVCGMCRQKESGVDIVHVFGRTPNPPYRYYHRQYNAKRNRWDPWRRMDADNESDQLVPIVWNRRLYAFWPVFVEQPDMHWTRTYLPEGAEPLNKWEIKIAWSEYRNGQWAPKRASSDGVFSRVRLEYYPEVGHPSEAWWYLPRQHEHYFRAAVEGDELVITCNRRHDAPADFWVGEQDGETVLWDNPPYFRFKDHFTVGSFAFTGCNGRAETDDAEFVLAFDSIREPEDTVNVNMAFDSTPQAADLTLRDSKTTRVLRDIESPFSFVPPQEIVDLGKTFYPFVFEDARRTYLAMPTVDARRRVSLAFAQPVVPIATHVDDPIVETIPLPDQGDPPIVPSRQLLSPMLRASRPAAGSFPSLRVLSDAQGPVFLVRDERITSGLVAFQDLPRAKPMMKKSKGGGLGKQADQVQPWLTTEAMTEAGTLYLKFHVLFHPHVCGFMKALNKGGIPALMAQATQRLDNDPVDDTVFDAVYDPAPIVHDDYPQEDVDFRPEGAYSLYNWELFLYGPLAAVDQLVVMQRYGEALTWLRLIFDPTSGAQEDAPAKYWRFLPFHENDESGRIEDLLEALNHGTPSQKKKIAQLVEDWRDNPYDPHMIARGRISAYQKSVVMRYIEILIKWGDLNLTKFTRESVSEATQLYVLASHLLGRRPERVPPRFAPVERTYADLKPILDGFSNAMIEMENVFPFTTTAEDIASGDDTGAEGLGTAPAFYFCIPPNDKLLSYWDLVEDRLFKIRHCMDIEGIVRELPLFEPPIDPALLVKAAAAGLDVSSVLADTRAPLTPYRFEFLSQRATELCGDAKSVGQELLSAFEKKDLEAMAVLRASHETSVLEAARDARREHIQEARRHLDALLETRKLTVARQAFYEQRRDQPVNLEEQAQLNKMAAARAKLNEAMPYEIAAQFAAAMPTLSFGGAGTWGSPLSSVSFGGQHVAAGNQAYARYLSDDAAAATYESTASGIRAAHTRRSEEWNLQLALATQELKQIDKQIAAAEIRVAIVEHDLATHDRQIANAKTIEEHVQGKLTSGELYTTLVAQLSTVFYQSYKLAYDMAKRAERAFRFERVTDLKFIEFGYWDSFIKGLLAPEKLLVDIKRMEAAYLDRRPEYELTMHVSLLLTDPLALVQLKEMGWCELAVTEAMCDAHRAGLYNRRTHAVSVTIPCVIGPYANVSCKLTLLSHKVRVKNVPAMPYAEAEDGNDDRFVTNFAATQAIVTSHAQNDSGEFEPDAHGPQFRKFEGTGLISRWRLELTEDKDLRTLDYDTIMDVVAHFRYRALDGGAVLSAAATDSLKSLVAASEDTPVPRLFSARHEFPSEWHRFLRPLAAQTTHVLLLNLVRDRFPFQFRGRELVLKGIELFFKFRSDVIHPAGDLLPAFVRSPGTDPDAPTQGLPSGAVASVASQYGGLPHLASLTFDEGVFGRWQIEVQKADVAQLLPALKRIAPDGNTPEQPVKDLTAALEDVYVVCHYAVGGPVS